VTLEDTEKVVLAVQEDDHGHMTLIIHGEPEIISELAEAVVVLIATMADIVDAESYVTDDPVGAIRELDGDTEDPAAAA